MFRRQFIHQLTLASASGLAASSVSEAGQRKTVTYKVDGFTCITCAVGLEVMLRRENGVVRAEASYPTASVLIEFDPSLITDKSLRQYIADVGFSVRDERFSTKD